jgi:putative copper export protein
MRLIRALAGAGVVASVMLLLTLSAMLGGDWASATDWSVMRILLGSSEGNATAARLAGLAVLGAIGIAGPVTQAIALAAALATVTSFALTGHAGAIGPRALVALHLIAVAYWVGALLPLYRVSANVDRVLAGAVLERFGTIAVLVVGVLIVAGATLALLLLGSVDALVSSGYGRLLLIKLALVATLLSLAALNKLRLTPAFAGGDSAAPARLRRSIAAELFLVVAILAVTATFTTVVGPPGLE